MLPSERRDVLDDVGRRRNAFAIELGESRFEIERVPINDGVDEQVQPGRSIELALESSVPQLSEAIEEQRPGQSVRLCCKYWSRQEAAFRWTQFRRRLPRTVP